MSILLQFNSSSELRLSHLQISTQLSDVGHINMSKNHHTLWLNTFAKPHALGILSMQI